MREDEPNFRLRKVLLFLGCGAGKFRSQISAPIPKNAGAEVSSRCKNSAPAPASGVPKRSCVVCLGLDPETAQELLDRR